MTLTKRQMVVVRRVQVYLILYGSLGLLAAAFVVGVFIGDGGP